MPWAIEIDGKQLRVEELSPADLSRIARKYDLSWVSLVSHPAVDPAALWDLIVLCCKQLDIDPPAEPATARELLDLLETALQSVDDDAPQEFQDGLPLVESDQET